jgi:guanylate kinase
VGAGPLLVVLTGPSGAGKDTLLAQLKSRSDSYHLSVNVTTRPLRSGETEGVDYHFVSKDDFQRMLDSDELLEHAIVYGQDKGVPKAPIRDALSRGCDVLLRTDVQGARTIKAIVPGAVTIFIAPPSERELRRRVKRRGTDSNEQVDIREQTAANEMAAAEEFDYIIVNEDIAQAVVGIETILARERDRPGRQAVRI